MQEPAGCNYLYIDDSNTVHLLVPVVGGETIGVDNTCSMGVSLKAFFFGRTGYPRNEPSAKRLLTSYKRDLEADIRTISQSDPVLLGQKQHRLEQINRYIGVLDHLLNDEKFNDLFLSGLERLPAFVNAVLSRQTNALAMHLRPASIDTYLSISEPYFALVRGESRMGAPFGIELTHTFKQTRWQTRRSAKDVFIETVVAETPSHLSGQALVTFLQSIMTRLLNQTSGNDVDLTRAIAIKGQNVTFDFLIENLLADDNDTAKEMTDTLLGTCLPTTFWDNDSSLFANTNTAEDLSIMTQFFIGQLCLYAHAHGALNSRSVGQTIETSSNLKNQLSNAVIHAKQGSRSVETALFNTMNKAYQQFGFTRALTSAEQREITTSFSANYQTIKDLHEKDEFVVFFPDVAGDFVNHRTRISMHFSDALNPQLLQNLSSSTREQCTSAQQWLRPARFAFKELEGQVLASTNEAQLGSLKEVENPEPLSQHIARLTALLLSGIEEVTSVARVPVVARELTEQVNEIELAVNRLLRCDRAGLLQACQAKRTEIIQLRDAKVACFEQEVVEQALKEIRLRVESIINYEAIEQACAPLVLDAAVDAALELIPRDEEFEFFNQELKDDLRLLSDIKRAEILSIKEQRMMILNPVFTLSTQIRTIVMASLILSVEPSDLIANKANLDATLLMLEEDIQALPVELKPQIEQQLAGKKAEVENTFDEQMLNLDNDAQYQVNVAQINEFVSRIDVINMPAITLDEEGKPLSGGASNTYSELDDLLVEARQAMPEADLSRLEDAILTKKVTIDSLIEQKRQAFFIRKQEEARTEALAIEINLLSTSAVNNTNTLAQYATEKNAVLDRLHTIEKRIEALPEDLNLSIQDLFQEKLASVNKVIDDKAKTSPLADLLADSNNRYDAIKTAFDTQYKKLNMDARNLWNSTGYRSKSMRKVNAMDESLNKIARGCLRQRISDDSKLSLKEQSDGLKTERQTIEFKSAVLEAWDDPESNLYQALNSKRSSFFGFSLTFFSGQSWSHCIDGDSATVKAMKESDPEDDDAPSISSPGF